MNDTIIYTSLTLDFFCLYLYNTHNMRKNKFNRRPQRQKKRDFGPKDTGLTVYVREGNVDGALKKFKRKVKNAGIMEDLKKKEFFQTRREGRRLGLQKTIRRQKRINESLKGLGFTKRGRI